MAKLPGAYELMATAASPAINFTRGLLGYQDPFLTQTMQDRMTELEAEKGPTGSIGYEDYDLPTAEAQVRDLDAIVEKLNTTFQEELKDEVEAFNFFIN